MSPDRPPLVVPFRGERFASATQLSSLLSPPYDVLGPAERAAYAASHADNIVHLILPEGTEGTRYARAAQVLADWRDREVVERDADPCVYVVRQVFQTPDGAEHVRAGVIGAVVAEPYEGGRVRPHERTHRGPKADRLALLEATGVQSEAIFLIARDERNHLRRRLDGVTHHEPHAVARLDDVSVSLWCVRGVQAREIARACGEALYIADGHHRYETATTAGAGRAGGMRLPALIVPANDPGLVVLATHRMFEGRSLDPDQVRPLLAERFAVEELPATTPVEDLMERLRGDGVRCVVVAGETAFACAADGNGGLPLADIEAWVVDPLRALAEGSVTYSPRPEDVIAAGGVLVPVTPLSAVFATADAGGIMPPKSTYFRPKVPSGLVWMPLDG